MAQRIRRFGVGQTAKMLGTIYTLFGVVLIPIFLLATMYAPDAAGFGVGVAVALPLIYGVIGFVFTAVGCLIYNLVAGWVGGIEIEIEEPAS